MKHSILKGLAIIILTFSGIASSSESGLCKVEDNGVTDGNTVLEPLPEREGPRIRTSGRVPHVQIGIEPVFKINTKLYKLAYSLPEVEQRPTIVSLPGTDGMWLNESLNVANPKAIVRGREFAHIHPDGSLHAPLSYERAVEITEKGWGERHPWADSRDGWEGFAMIFTPQTEGDLKVVFQLIVESYNYVTGQNLKVTDC